MEKKAITMKPRNWVAKNNFNRPATHRDRTQYQRQPKHRSKEVQYEDRI